MWHDSPAARRLGIRYPIIQGPFGGGMSSPALAAVVSNAGGLGSYGAQGQPPSRITALIAEIRALTSSPFAINLWVSTDDEGAERVTRADYDAALQPLMPFFTTLGTEPPAFPLRGWERFDAQVRALLDARPPVFSFIFGIPPADVLQECTRRGIVTIGTATTPEEAIAIERAGVDVLVATGFEAGGHRASFLRSAEASLTGTFALVPQVADAVEIPVIAAGGIADGRGIAAALTLGADGVQIGTAFLACDESNAAPVHKQALLDASQARLTSLTRSFTGRLARGLRNTLFDALDTAQGPRLPYPLQGYLVNSLREEAVRQGRADLLVLWAGQSTPLLRHRRAAELFEALVADTAQRLANRTPPLPARGERAG